MLWSAEGFCQYCKTPNYFEKVLGEDLGKKLLKWGKTDFVTRQISLIIFIYSQINKEFLVKKVQNDATHNPEVVGSSPASATRNRT